MIDIKQFVLLEDLNKTRSISASAMRLGYTQSGVSHAIKKMENQWGMKLLKRTNHGVELTSEAKYLLPYVQSILVQYNRFNEAMDAINGLTKGSVTIGSYSSIARHWLPKILQAFNRSYPQIQIHVREGDYDEIMQWIGQGTVDFGFVSKSGQSNFAFIPFQKEMLYVVVPDHCWTGSFPIHELEQHPYIASEIGVDNDVAATLHQAGINPHVTCYCKEDASILAMVKQGLGLSILPELIVKDVDIHCCPLDPPAYRTLGIMYKSEDGLSSADKALIEIAKDQITHS